MVKILRALTVLLLQVNGFSIPGLVPKNYKREEKLPIYAGRLESDFTELEYEFYDVNWCNNTEGLGYDGDRPPVKKLRGVAQVHSPMEVSSTL